jgi:hypothetical protein
VWYDPDMSDPHGPTEQLTLNYAAWEVMDRRSGPGLYGRRWLRPGSRARYLRLLAGSVQRIRDEVGDKVRVISGERAHSKTAKSSRHVPPEDRADPRERGDDAAADLATAFMSATELACLALRLMGQGVIPAGGVGVYPAFAHLDNRGRVATWRGPGVSDADYARVTAAAQVARQAIRTRMEVG